MRVQGGLVALRGGLVAVRGGFVCTARRLWAALPGASDALCGLGLLAFLSGLWMVWPPLSLLAGGAALAAAGVLLELKRKAAAPREPYDGRIR